MDVKKVNGLVSMYKLNLADQTFEQITVIETTAVDGCLVSVKDNKGNIYPGMIIVPTRDAAIETIRAFLIHLEAESADELFELRERFQEFEDEYPQTDI